MIRIIPGQFSLEDFHLSREYLDSSYRAQSTTGYGDSQNVNSSARSAKWIALDYTQRELIKEAIEFMWNDSYRFIEEPQLVSYSPGERYTEHNDSEEFIDGRWKKVVDRDYTVIFYLNSDFVGGELVFPEQGVSISPKEGSIVLFPSNHIYPHEVMPVQDGVRYAIVSWIAV